MNQPSHRPYPAAHRLGHFAAAVVCCLVAAAAAGQGAPGAALFGFTLQGGLQQRALEQRFDATLAPMTCATG